MFEYENILESKHEIHSVVVENQKSKMMKEFDLTHGRFLHS